MRFQHCAPRLAQRVRGESGQIAIMVALAAVIMFAFVGIAIDVGRMYVTKAELSRAVDAAALSGILELDGTTAGRDAARVKAEDYFAANEPDAQVEAFPDTGESELTVTGSKTVKMYFLSVIGIHQVTVSAHARSGFGTQYLDVVMALDATPSMQGNPLTNAKAAAINFKNILLGTNPDGNVLVGMTPFRGCFQPPVTSSDCINTSTQVAGLTDNSGTLNSKINAITGGGSTNVCTGLAQAWNIFSGDVAGSPAHFDDDLYPNNRQYLVLLSDGDNYYDGGSTYQDPYYTSGSLNSSSSPTGTTVGGTVYPCQPIDASSGNVGDKCPSPWNNPSISSTYPCYKGVHVTTNTNTNTDTIASDNFNSSSSGMSGGTGWSSGSWNVASSQASRSTSDSPQGAGHVQFKQTSSSNDGQMTRTFSMSGKTNGVVSFYAKRNSDFSGSSDRFYVEVSTNGTNWTTLSTFAGSTASGVTRLGTSYDDYSVALPSSMDNASTVYLRFRGVFNNNSDRVWVDTITVEGDTTTTTSVPSPADGYLNGNDGSNPADCVYASGRTRTTLDQTPRERQMDVRTMKLAEAIRAQGVEIYVVAFAGDGSTSNCYLNQDVKYDHTNPSDCGVVTDNSSYPIGKSGPDGSTNPSTPNPNVRLLQCIASSSPDSKDHYFYASSSSELGDIFTYIANQISLRLIE